MVNRKVGKSEKRGYKRVVAEQLRVERYVDGKTPFDGSDTNAEIG